MKSNSIGVFLGVIASLIWGSWPVVSKIAEMDALSPVDIASLRFTIAGMILLPVLICQKIKFRLIFTKGIILAIGAGAPYVVFATYGINLSSSAHFGVIAPSTMLFFSFLGSVLLFKEKIFMPQLIGIGLIVLGVIGIGVLNFNTLNTNIILGDLMFVVCGALWASFTLFSKYWQLNSWAATSMVSVLSGIVCAPFSFKVIQNNSIDILFYHGIYQGLLVAIIALYCYSKSVFILGATKGAIFASLVPPISLILSFLVLDEEITTYELIGSIFICIGVALALGVIKFNQSGIFLIQKKSN